MKRLSIFLLLFFVVFASEAQKTFDTKGKDTISTRSGLKYIVVQEGTGKAAFDGAKVTVHYCGYFEDGSVFDSSWDRKKPFVFHVGQKEVITGWDEGVLLMNEGDKYHFIIPYNLGYGAKGEVDEDGKVLIPEYCTLYFDVELIKVK